MLTPKQTVAIGHVAESSVVAATRTDVQYSACNPLKQPLISAQTIAA